MNKKLHFLWQVFPIMMAFFAMGYIDLVGIATNYVKKDFGLSDSMANLYTSMVFLWFLIFSVPTGMIMNKIGRRKTVMISLAISIVGLTLPLLHYDLPLMLITFCLIGIGNTVMQVSLNPLLSNIVSSNRLSSALTLGQFIKAIAAFSAPIIAGWAALRFGNWRMLFPIFLVEGLITLILLWGDKIKEEEITGHASTFKECFSLLKDSIILICFLGIICHVGIDISVNLSAPRLLIEKLGLPLEDAAFAASMYFLFRTIGSLIGVFALANFATRRFFGFSVLVMFLAMLGLLFAHSETTLYILFALIGFGNANVFPILFSQGILHLPDKKNEISGLMIMGLFGGAIFPPIIGWASDTFASQNGAVLVMAAGVLYLLLITGKIKNTDKKPAKA